MDSSEVHSYLNTFANFESQLHKMGGEDFTLTRIQKLLSLVGNPDQNLKIIHVAGTKGKGSTCAFLSRILQEAGYKVGLYTSPHLHNVNERIRILDHGNLHSQEYLTGCIADEKIDFIVKVLRPHVDQIYCEGGWLTYFEVLTVIALYYFAQAKVDIVILETGLGGRLDATNAVNSSVAVITPVSLDHIKILGPTLKQIAFEKAGIIKNSHQRVVVAPQEQEAMDVIAHRCQEFGVQPVVVSLNRVNRGQSPGYGLKGRHQMINAATAIEVINILNISGFKISDTALSNGLKNVSWPGRFELLRKSPDVIVDCAHNEASAQALSETLKEEYPHQRVILILGISQDKDIAAICNHLKKNTAHIILTKTYHPRAHVFTQAEGKDYFDDKPVEIGETVSESIEKALQLAGPQDIIVVTGSVFIVAEAIEKLRGVKHVSV